MGIHAHVKKIRSTYKYTCFSEHVSIIQQRKKIRKRGTNQKNILKKETGVTGKKGNQDGFDYCPNRFFYYVGYRLPLIYQYAMFIFLTPTFL